MDKELYLFLYTSSRLSKVKVEKVPAEGRNVTMIPHSSNMHRVVYSA